MSYYPRLNIDALIFAINDVLIDVSRSYREVVCKTVQLYLEQTIGLPASGQPLLMPDEVTWLQKAGHFTNYQDLATAFIMYFIELLPPVSTPTFPSRVHVPAIIAYLQLAAGRLGIGIDALREQKDIAQLARQVAAAGGGLEGAHAALPKINRHLLVNEGAITKTNLVGRIFHELYLGADLFEQIHQEPAVVVQSKGYIRQEALLIDLDILVEISHKLPLAVVADAPQVQVESSLKAQNIEEFFQTTVSLDDVQEARAKPLPAPWALLEAARRLKPTPARSAYIGANPADMQAAKAANQTVPFTAIGCLYGAHDREALRREFEKSTVDIILGHPDNLKELILD